MNLVKKIFLLIAISISGTMFSQSVVCDSSNWAKVGTYEIVTIPGSSEAEQSSAVSLPSAVLCEIEQMRKDNKTVEYVLNQSILIRIYPKNQQPKLTTHQ